MEVFLSHGPQGPERLLARIALNHVTPLEIINVQRLMGQCCCYVCMCCWIDSR